jgi:hypothetical protein
MKLMCISPWHFGQVREVCFIAVAFSRIHLADQIAEFREKTWLDSG